MKVAIMQPYLFPYIGYFQLINHVDKFIIYDDVAYINKGWINRNNILVNGKAFLFTVPLKDASQNKLIKEIELLDVEKWRIKFLKTIEASYKKSPNYGDISPIIERIVLANEKSLSRLIIKSLREINSYLEINTEIIESSDSYNNGHLKGQNRILDICLKENASNYINPIGGMELYSKKIFEQYGIQLNFIKSIEFKYNQYNDEFVPWLSIIDLLMFTPKSNIKYFINKYEIV